MDFVGSRQLGGGAVELRHRPRKHPNVRIVTAITPRDGAVEFLARPEVEDPAGAPLPDDLPTPNLCWNMRRAEAFRSKPDPFPEFVQRCFLFTREGLTFLDRTARRKIPAQPPDHEYNNPVWVQMYEGTGRPFPGAAPVTGPLTAPTATPPR